MEPAEKIAVSMRWHKVPLPNRQRKDFAGLVTAPKNPTPLYENLYPVSLDSDR